MGSIPVSGRSPGGGNGNPVQDSCLANPIDRGSWHAAVHGVTKTRTRYMHAPQAITQAMESRVMIRNGGRQPACVWWAPYLLRGCANFPSLYISGCRVDLPPPSPLNQPIPPGAFQLTAAERTVSLLKTGP